MDLKLLHYIFETTHTAPSGFCVEFTEFDCRASNSDLSVRGVGDMSPNLECVWVVFINSDFLPEGRR